MSTPHIEAEAGAFADTVLFPGDPLRARFIAEQFFTAPVQVNGLRNMLGFTGTWRGRRVSVMGSGMGIASSRIYATELIRHHGVRRLIRVGTCGGVGEVALGDLLLAQSASTDSRVNRIDFGGHDLAACADFGLLRRAVEAAERHGFDARVAPIFSTDNFYDGDPNILDHLRRHRIVGVEMEAAGLYSLARREGAAALAILTVSDHLDHGSKLPAEARERGLGRMVELALEAALGAA